jgi:hypothetical protein
MDPDPAIFVIDLKDANNFSKIKSQKEVAKQQESMFFLKFLLDNRRIRIQPAQKPTDPDSIRIRNTVFFVLP